MSRLRALGCAVFAAAMTVISAGVVSERANAASPCWERVIADWSDNGRVDRTYQLVCYREAVKRMPEDLRAYSSAPAEIDRALAERRVALPASSGALPSRPASSQRDAGGAGPSLAMLVPPAAAVFAALAVGWWLFGARRRRPSRGR